MKRKIPSRFIYLCVSAIILLSLSISDTFAQLKLDYGPKAGPNVSWFIGNLPFEGMKKPKIGLSAGAFVNLRSTRKKFFQFEANALFTFRGNRAEYLDSNTIGKGSNYRLLYLEISPIFKFLLSTRTDIRPYLLVGPSVCGIMNATAVINGEKYDDDRTRPSITRDDFGITFGGGLTWFYLDRWYFLDARYYRGLRFVNDRINQYLEPWNVTNTSNNQRDAPIYNSTISITFAVSLSRQIKTFQ